MTDTLSEKSPIAGFFEVLKNSRAQSLLERVDELRVRLARVALVGFALFIGAFVFAKQIFAVLKAPLIESLPPAAANLHFTGPMEVFLCYVQVAFLLSTLLVAPLAFFEAWRFLEPALPDEQRRLVKPCFVSSLALFAAGLAFSFFVILPPSLALLIGMGAGVATPIITVGDYVSLLVYMLLGFGLVFQLPLVLIVLERLGLIQVETLSSNRGIAIVAILSVAAVVTPTPDPFSQLAMAIPMYVMYEGAILVIKRLGRADQRSDG